MRSGRMWRTVRSAALPVALAATALATTAVATTATAAPATAATQHPNAYYYSHWAFPAGAAGYLGLDQRAVVQRKAPSTFWAQAWTWTGSTDGGYVGLQTDGDRGDGSHGDTAIFSIWDAAGATGPHCLTFGGEGVGYSCRLAYSVEQNTVYTFRLRGRTDADGVRWTAWIHSGRSNSDSRIGTILVPAGTGPAANVQNFVEYFGDARPCDQVPESQVVWLSPVGIRPGGGTAASDYQAKPGDRGSCTGGAAVPLSPDPAAAVLVTLGG